MCTGRRSPFFQLRSRNVSCHIKDVIRHVADRAQNNVMADEVWLPTPLPETRVTAKRRLPSLIEAAGHGAAFAYDEFLDATLPNEYTRTAYRRAIDGFLARCSMERLRLCDVSPSRVATYIHALETKRGLPASKSMQKQHLAAIRHLFDRLVIRHVVPINPAASVRGPSLKVAEGKTAALSVAQARQVLACICTTDLVGLRDRAIIAVLIYTAARAGAVARLRREDFYTDGRQWWFRFDEKGGNVRDIPARHDLEAFMHDYLNAVGPATRESALFRTAAGQAGRLSSNGLTGNDILRMVKRRLARAGLPTGRFSCHSFRATTATDLLIQGVPIEEVQFLLGHADLRTTKLYDRRQRQVTRNIVERISV